MTRVGKWVLWNTERDCFDLTKAKGLPDPPYETRTLSGFISISKVVDGATINWVFENIKGELICRRVLHSRRMGNGNWEHVIDFD